MKPHMSNFASVLAAYQNCERKNNHEWKLKHLETLHLMEKLLPNGSGFDAGTTIDVEKSTPEKLVFKTSYHHSNEHGYYTRWTEHTVTVRASLRFGVRMTVSGRDYNSIKEYIHDVFLTAFGD